MDKNIATAYLMQQDSIDSIIKETGVIPGNEVIAVQEQAYDTVLQTGQTAIKETAKKKSTDGTNKRSYNSSNTRTKKQPGKSASACVLNDKRESRLKRAHQINQ